LLLCINLDYLVHVATHIDHHRDVARLARKTGSGPSSQNRRVVAPTHFDDALDIRLIERKDNAKWHLAIVRRVRCVDPPRGAVELNASMNYFDEIAF
jgi:hypothetical protein